MRLLAVILGCSLVIAALPSHGAKGKKPAVPEWVGKLPAAQPGAFPAMEPGEALYRFGWSGLTAAESTLLFSESKPGVTRIDLKAQTTGMVRSLWRLDADAVSTCDSKSFAPIRARQREQYKKKTVLTVQEFEPGSVLRAKGPQTGATPAGFFDDTFVDKDKIQKWTGKRAKRFTFPQLFDLPSAYLYVRSQPLAKGDELRLVVFQGNSPYLATVKVLGREAITVAAGTFQAIKMDLSLRAVQKDLSLKAHGSFKRATGWFSDDPRRLLLKVEAEVIVGSVWAELARFTPAGGPGPVVVTPPAPSIQEATQESP